MCGHLIDKGYQTTIYNRTISKTLPLQAKGATLAHSPAEVADNSDILFTIVGFPSDVHQVILDPQKGALSSLKKGSIIIDMTTSSPQQAQQISQSSQSLQIHSLDAPVSGGDIGAKTQNLSIMVGGEEPIFSKVLPLFQILGKNINYMGPSGSGQNTKMVNQILIASNMIGVVEGLIYGFKSGLDLDQVIKAVGSGAAGSFSVNNLGPRIVKERF